MTDRDVPHDDPREKRPEDAALDARLRAAFAPPPDVGDLARSAVADARRAPAPRSTRLLPRFAAAAVLLVALGGLWWWTGRAGEGSAAPAAPIAKDATGGGRSVIGSIYDDITRQCGESGVEAGACQSPLDLADVFDERYGSPLYVKIRPERPVLGPFPYEALPGVTVLCGMTDGRPIPIVVGAPGDDPPPGLESDGVLNCYRRDLGGLVLYELSPLDAPACLDLFSTSPE